MDRRKFIVNLVKQKKEISNIDDRFVEGLLDNYISKNRPIWSIIEMHPRIEKSREARTVVKEIRKKLRKIYGVFNITPDKKNRLLHNLEIAIKSNSKDEIERVHNDILLTHKSTRERLDYYPIIYRKIFSITSKPKSILDIGSGLNPISLPYMQLNKVKYTAIEFTSEDCSFLNKYFAVMKPFHITGKAIKMDLLNESGFPRSDVCFMFKLLDSLETMKRNLSKKMIESIDAKFIVVSFPKKTLSGKQLSTKRLAWFKKIADIHYEFEVENEIFYILKK